MEQAGLVIAFNGGFDSTHNPRELGPGVGVRCDDLDLRKGRFEVRGDPAKFHNVGSGVDVHVYEPSNLLLAAPAPGGDVLLVASAPQAGGSVGYLQIVRALAWERPDIGSPPTFGEFDFVSDRAGGPVYIQLDEPMEAMFYGDKVYICNAGAAIPGRPEIAGATLEVDLRDLKGKFLAEADWPKSRHIVEYMGYAVLLDCISRGPRTMIASDLPLAAGTPTWDLNWDEITGDPDERMMRGVYDGDSLLVFLKRSTYRYVGSPTQWVRDLILDTGTLSPETVRTIGGFTYFLGDDGIPYRTNGQRGVAERVGAFDYEGKMRHIDGRCPIEDGLRDYYLAPSQSYSELRWQSATDFGACTLADVEFVDGVGVRLTKIWGTEMQAGFADGEVEGFHGAGTTYYNVPPVGGPGEVWQSWKVDITKNPPRTELTHGMLLNKVTLSLQGVAGVTYHMILSLYEHPDDSTPSADLTPLKVVVAEFDGIGGSIVPVDFDFEDLPLEWETAQTYRLGLECSDGTGSIWWGDVAGGYVGGRAQHGAGEDMYFKVFGKVYSQSGSITSEVAGDAVDKDWGLLSALIDDEQASSIKVRKPGSAWNTVPSGSSVKNILAGSQTVQWRVTLAVTDEEHRAVSPVLNALVIDYQTGTSVLSARPFAVVWDGRYLLSLRRQDSEARDVFVWDREAWSKWLVGVTQATVMNDLRRRPRLVYTEKIPGATAMYVMTLLSEIRLNLRGRFPAYRTGSLPLDGGAGLMVMQPHDITVYYTEVDGSLPGRLVYLYWRVDNGDWHEHNITLNGDTSEHTMRLEVESDEGRYFELVVGENPAGSSAAQVPVVIDRVIVMSQPIGPRWGLHETGR